jgi:hypothetical protein
MHVSCPACGTRVSLARFLAAPTPWHLSCSQCQAWIRLQRFPWLGALGLLLFFLGLGGWMGYSIFVEEQPEIAALSAGGGLLVVLLAEGGFYFLMASRPERLQAVPRTGPSAGPRSG